MRYRKLFAGLLGFAAAAGCTPEAPIDNGAATTCASGTPEADAGAVCADVTLRNGATVAAPPVEEYERALENAVAANAS